MDLSMKISVITVCFNAEKVIEDTILSVMNQTYEYIEYIIIDGASTDNTLDIVSKYGERLRIKIISEPDQGIYDAMNKGILLATGDYIHFLNAGDEYYDADVIRNVVENIKKTNADIVYGHIVYRYSDDHIELRKYGKSCGKRIYYLTGDCINHQAMLVNKKLFERASFNINYKICADREWMMHQSKLGANFYAMEFPVCIYRMDGISMLQKDIYQEEAKLCMRKHFKFGYPIFSVFEFMRNNKFLSKILHGLYQKLYIRKDS